MIVKSVNHTVVLYLSKQFLVGVITTILKSELIIRFVQIKYYGYYIFYCKQSGSKSFVKYCTTCIQNTTFLADKKIIEESIITNRILMYLKNYSDRGFQ